MSEPITGAAAGAASWKAIGGLAGMGAIGAGLASFVVMSMSKPKSDREWHVALTSTIVGSIGGGAALVQYLGIQNWAQSFFGVVAMLGLAFACGLPAWGIVRALFNFTERRKDADLVDLVKEVKREVW